MGQYHMVVNLDKREFVSPHKLGCGLKLWEQLANGEIGGTSGALLVLLACSNGRGGGDLDTGENWHGPERVIMADVGPAPPLGADGRSYADIAASMIGRWAGDRIAVVGDYAEDSDLAPEHYAAMIYGLCHDAGTIAKSAAYCETMAAEATGGIKNGLAAAEWRARGLLFRTLTPFTDISEDVLAVLAHELHLTTTTNDTGWRSISRAK